MRTDGMWLVYVDAAGNEHAQPWGDLTTAGTLIDPETGDDMEIVGWMTEGGN
ncbi:hypothetical protein SEA_BRUTONGASTER_155 [Gordonia phage BrutonGaster]|uniref:Uncharacterized protein n=1 Tax=Gordonia phage BrutonGaster TaxID=2530116 RepID=A0A482JLR6_9CAUD|nr:hypothetical protein HOV26_gp027 [Gordonia phage BrutonGaster]QBP33369.1 hypothetical protein SEA_BRUTONGASTER_155 [Gordonia phage BrutonGaster]